MNAQFDYAIADPDFYAPLEHAVDRGETFRPTRVPQGWRAVESGIWAVWHRAGRVVAGEGWKVHVSARSGRLAEVLDIAAAVCFEKDVAFKHLSSRLFYTCTHQKHASRPQAGKFIAAYPSDTETARALMESLSDALAGEDGPHILTDRRFPGSLVVHYRYGGFAEVAQVKADGTRSLLVRDGHGELVRDHREAGFRLPAGVTDPFAAPIAPLGGANPISFGGFAFEKVIRHSAGGGTYRAREESTGRTVFVKEARAHIGGADDGRDAREWLRTEWETLRELHTCAPGLAPEPVAHFSEWEHDFLATEFVDGITMNKWMVRNAPLVRLDATAEDFAAYYERCEKVISDIELALDRLHGAGYLFMDVSPGNVLITDNDDVRLVDFEAVRRIDDGRASIGTPGYTPPRRMIGDDPTLYDSYGAASLTQLLVAPLIQVVERNPASLTHLHHMLTEIAPVPPALWKRMTTFHTPGENAAAPTPEQVAENPVAHLETLREQVGDALLAMADVERPGAVFPTIVTGYQTNTLCVAYGTAGVVYALGQADRAIPGDVLEHLRRESLAAADELAPGFYVGTAGMARVLADHGHLDEARTLLDAADRHPLTARNATLFGGAAGVALSHLALYRHTGEQRHLDRAAGYAAAIPLDDSLTEQLGEDNATGLMHGRTGVALLLHQLAAFTGESGYLQRGIRLLHAELDRESDPSSPGMAFPVSNADRRQMPYLYCGSAGMVHVATRYLQAVDDERLSLAMPRLLTQLRTPYTVMPGLFQGHAGLGFALADRALLTGDQADREAAVRVGRALFTFAIPHSSGVRFPGDQLTRLSAELWSGSAGILLFLTQLLDPRADTLFTLDT